MTFEYVTQMPVVDLVDRAPLFKYPMRIAGDLVDLETYVEAHELLAQASQFQKQGTRERFALTGEVHYYALEDEWVTYFELRYPWLIHKLKVHTEDITEGWTVNV